MQESMVCSIIDIKPEVICFHTEYLNVIKYNFSLVLT